MPTPGDLLHWLTAPWRRPLERDELTVLALQRINRLESRMTMAENAAYNRAAEVVGLIRAEFESLRSQLANVDAALEADAQADAERLTALVDELVSVLPSGVPDVPVPDPGQPAELPEGDEPPAEDPPAEPTPAV